MFRWRSLSIQASKSMIQRIFYGGVMLVSMCVLVGCQTSSAISSKQSGSDIRVQLAAEYIRLGDLDAAKRSLDYVFAVDKSHATALMMMGVLLQHEGSAESLQQANHYFQRAIQSSPEQAQIRANYGAYLIQVGAYEQAIPHLTLAGRQLGYEQRYAAWQNLGHLYVKLNDLAAAEQSFRQALSASPLAYASLLDLAEVYYVQQRWQEATNTFQQYREWVSSPQEMNAQAIWLGLRLARANRQLLQMQQYAQRLQQDFVNSPENQRYQHVKYSMNPVWQ